MQEEDELDGELADFESYLNGQLIDGVLDDLMVDTIAQPKRRVPLAPNGVTTHAIKAFVKWNHTLATIAFPSPSSAWVYLSGASHLKQEWSLGPIRLLARHITCMNDPSPGKIVCRPCLNREKWRRRCETPVHVFILYDSMNDGGRSATAALNNLQILPASALGQEEVQYYQNCEPKPDRRSPFSRSVSTISIDIQRVSSVSTPTSIESPLASSPLALPPPQSPSPFPVATCSQAFTIERAMLLCMRHQTNGTFASSVIQVLASSPPSFDETRVLADPLCSSVLAPMLPTRLMILMAHDSIRMLAWARLSEPPITNGTSLMQLAFSVPKGRTAFQIACDPTGFAAADGLDSLSITLPHLATGQQALLVLTSDGLTPTDHRRVIPYAVLLKV